MTSRLKVLISAYACNPNIGSEHGVGWGWVNAIARNHDVHVITAEFQREDIEQAMSKMNGQSGRLDFHYVRRKPWHYRPTRGWRYIEESPFKPIMNLAYASWQKDAFRLGQELHAQHKFDIVHLVTFVGFRFPGQLWRLEAPFVWGPIGGLENTPWRLLPMLGPGGMCFYAVRNIINSLQKRFQIGPRQAFRRASGIIAATETIRREIKKYYARDSEVICEIGPPPVSNEVPSARSPEEPLRLVWSGLHLSGKALPLLLNGLAGLPDGVRWCLDVLGAGPCTGKWRIIADERGLSDKITWYGRIPRTEAVQVMQNAHVSVITSLKDLTSTVLLESLSQGVPVVCLDHCGFANVVSAECGIKIPVTTRREIQEGIVRAVTYLYEHEDERLRLALGALARSRDFTWEKKASQISAIYEKAVEVRKAR